MKLYKTETGNYYLPQFALKDLIRNEIIDNKIFDKKVYETAIKYIKEDSIVLDVGANFGLFTLYFSNQWLCNNGERECVIGEPIIAYNFFISRAY